ncbi:hypothetical protein AAZX31_15G224100 [Glycine max]
MLLFLILELAKNMLYNLGINSLKKVIFLMVMKSHSITGIMNKFGKLLLEVKRIETTVIVIVTKLSLSCLFCLLTLSWSMSILVFSFNANNLITINVTYIFIFVLFFILILYYIINKYSYKINYK